MRSEPLQLRLETVVLVWMKKTIGDWLPRGSFATHLRQLGGYLDSFGWQFGRFAMLLPQANTPLLMICPPFQLKSCHNSAVRGQSQHYNTGRK
eukprot:m.131413 g.131413  ORF g.131413 m.131413 type:complete len:93 (+) comp23730_c0_seq1:721-999(+)